MVYAVKSIRLNRHKIYKVGSLRSTNAAKASHLRYKPCLGQARPIYKVGSLRSTSAAKASHLKYKLCRGQARPIYKVGSLRSTNAAKASHLRYKRCLGQAILNVSGGSRTHTQLPAVNLKSTKPLNIIEYHKISWDILEYP